MNVTYISRDQDWANKSTTYWFRLDGQDYGTKIEFDDEVFGVVESGCDAPMIVDCDGAPITVGDGVEIAARRHCIVSDDLRDL